MQLTTIGTLTLTMPAPSVVEGGPSGTRVIVEFTEVVLEGVRIRAQRKGATAGDWLTIGPERTAGLDARFLLETDDGALVYVFGPGRTDAAGFASGEAPVTFALLFETGDARYAWLNRVVATARGFANGPTVTLEVAAPDVPSA